MKQKKLLLFVFLLWCNLIYAQNQEKLPDKTGVWILDNSVNNVDMYHMITDCNGKKVTFLKFENKNNYSVQIAWKEVFVTEQVSDKIRSINGEKKLELLAGQLAVPKCGETSNPLIIHTAQALPHFRADIRNFEFKDVLVTSLK